MIRKPVKLFLDRDTYLKLWPRHRVLDYLRMVYPQRRKPSTIIKVCRVGAGTIYLLRDKGSVETDPLLGAKLSEREFLYGDSAGSAICFVANDFGTVERLDRIPRRRKVVKFNSNRKRA